jgi:hypothetical protein
MIRKSYGVLLVLTIKTDIVERRVKVMSRTCENEIRRILEAT